MEHSPSGDVGLLFRPFQFLIDDLGFHVVSSDIAPTLGNMYVQVTNGILNVRVVRDRGFENAEVSPHFAPEAWLPLAHLRKIVLACDPLKDVNLDEEADFLRCQYATIAEMVSAANLENTELQIRQIGKQRLKKLFPGSIRD